jgi:hypothetical protein
LRRTIPVLSVGKAALVGITSVLNGNRLGYHFNDNDVRLLNEVECTIREGLDWRADAYTCKLVASLLIATFSAVACAPICTALSVRAARQAYAGTVHANVQFFWAVTAGPTATIVTAVCGGAIGRAILNTQTILAEGFVIGTSSA